MRDKSSSTSASGSFSLRVLHQIADTDNSFELVIVDHGKVADLSPRHRRESGIDAIGRTATDNRRGHQLLYIEAECVRTVTGDRIDEIPLRKDTNELHPRFDNERTDTVFGRTARATLSPVCNLTTSRPLVFKNVSDNHPCCLLIWCPGSVRGDRAWRGGGQILATAQNG